MMHVHTLLPQGYLSDLKESLEVNEAASSSASETWAVHEAGREGESFCITVMIRPEIFDILSFSRTKQQ